MTLGPLSIRKIQLVFLMKKINARNVMTFQGEKAVDSSSSESLEDAVIERYVRLFFLELFFLIA